MEVLLEAGSVVDAVTTSGSTALHSAASNGHAEVLQRLIQAGADVDVQVGSLLFVQVNSLCNDCFGYQEICPYIEGPLQSECSDC